MPTKWAVYTCVNVFHVCMNDLEGSSRRDVVLGERRGAVLKCQCAILDC